MTKNSVQIIDNSDRVETLLEPFRGCLGSDYEAYRGHVYRTLTYAMHFLHNDDTRRALVETALVYHDIGLWTDDELAYLEPSEELAQRDNEEMGLGLDPQLLKAVIHWHHKISDYSGEGAVVVNAVRKADWIDATQGTIRKGLSRAQIAEVVAAIPDPGFRDVLLQLASSLGGSTLGGGLQLLRRVIKF